MSNSEEKKDENCDNVPICIWECPSDLEGSAILNVDGVKIEVNKPYLSMYSPIFHRMFYADFREKMNDVYEVGMLKSGDFLEMLRVIYPTRKPIDVHNVENLLVIADRFLMYSLRKDCISFLCSSNGDSIETTTLIVLAFQYTSEQLKDRVKCRLFTQELITGLKHSTRFDELTQEARAWLFDLIVKRPASQSLKRVLCNDRCDKFDWSGRCSLCGRKDTDL